MSHDEVRSQSKNLQDLYQATILKHYKNPLQHSVPGSALQVERNNPLCGDKVRVFSWTAGDLSLPEKLHFFAEGRGCALCVASASVLSQTLHDQTLEAAQCVCQTVDAVLHVGSDLGLVKDLAVDVYGLCGVLTFPIRLKCVRLPWEACLELLSTLAVQRKGIEKGDSLG